MKRRLPGLATDARVPGFVTASSLFEKKEFALTHTLAGGMSHTDVNHTYSLAFSPSGSNQNKNQTETRRPDSSTPTATPLKCLGHLPIAAVVLRCRWLAHAGKPQGPDCSLSFIFTYLKVTLPVMIAFVAQNHGNIWPLPLWFPFSHQPLQEHEQSNCLHLSRPGNVQISTS